MEASTGSDCNEWSKIDEWTVVLPRRGRQGRRRVPKLKLAQEQDEEQEQHWVPHETIVDPQLQQRTMQKMEISMKKMEGSQFYKLFLAQIESPEVSGCFRHVLGSELHLKMVIYGIGSIESYENPRCQLSIAILMKKKFDWIGDIEIFDPILSATESKVLEQLGCSVLSVNENGRREVTKPIMFFMPHCEAELYSNLLLANQKTDRLSRIVVFGNSFQTYEQQLSERKSLLDPQIVSSIEQMVNVRRITREFEIAMTSDDYFAAFHDSSWHFFFPDSDSELPSIDS